MTSSEAKLLFYLRDALVFKRGTTVAYRNGTVADVHAVDEAFLQCLLEGRHDLGGLAHALANRGLEGDAEAWTRRLRELTRQSSTAVKCRRDVVRPEPMRIVVHLSPWVGEVDGAALARDLARDGHVWLVTHTATPREVARCEASGVTVCHVKQFAGVFDFLQWTKGLPHRFADTPLLLCGEADAVCIGGAAAYGSVVLVASDGWPGGAGAFQLWPSHVGDRDHPQVLDDALYAAVGSTGDAALPGMRRAASSSMGMLEVWAMLGARRVLYRTRRQGEALLRLGVLPKRLVIRSRVKPRTERNDVPRDGLLLLASPRNELRELLPVAELAARVVARGAFRFAALRSFDSWFSIGFAEDRVGIQPWPGAVPSMEQFSLALGIVERLEDLSALPDCVGAGCRLRLVPSDVDEPLVAALPHEAWLRGGPQDWVDQVCADRAVVSEPAFDRFFEQCQAVNQLRDFAGAQRIPQEQT